MQNRSLLGTTSNDKNSKIDLDDLCAANDQYDDFLNQLKRISSDGLLYARLFSKKQDIPRTNSVHISIPTTIIVNPSSECRASSGLRMLRNIKKEKKKNQSDYRKNICGYITKKVLREFLNSNYSRKIQQICSINQCSYQQAKTFYTNKIQHVTGPSHIPSLLMPENESQVKIKLVFQQFFTWFLKERYLRYLLLEGKMSNKKAYIDYKNNTLLQIINTNKRLLKSNKYNKINEIDKKMIETRIPSSNKTHTIVIQQSQ